MGSGGASISRCSSASPLGSLFNGSRFSEFGTQGIDAVFSTNLFGLESVGFLNMLISSPRYLVVF